MDSRSFDDTNSCTIKSISGGSGTDRINSIVGRKNTNGIPSNSRETPPILITNEQSSNYTTNFNKNPRHVTNTNSNSFNENYNSMIGTETNTELSLPLLSVSPESCSESQQQGSLKEQSSFEKNNSKIRGDFKLELRAEDETDGIGNGSSINDSSFSAASTIRIKKVPLSSSLSSQYLRNSSQPTNLSQIVANSVILAQNNESKSVQGDFVVTKDNRSMLSCSSGTTFSNTEANSADLCGSCSVSSSHSSSSSDLVTMKFNNGSNPFQNCVIPHLTYSPEAPLPQPTTSNKHLNNTTRQIPHSTDEILSPSKLTPTKLFGNFKKMKSTLGVQQRCSFNNNKHPSGGASAFLSYDSPSGFSIRDASRPSLSSTSTSAVSASELHLEHHQEQHQNRNTNHDLTTNLNSILNEKYTTNHSNTKFNHSHSSSNISSTEENFECIGEGTESLMDSHSEHASLQYSRDLNDLSSLSVPVDSSRGPPIRRNTWLRTSLRKSPLNQSGSLPNGEIMGQRRWGSFRNSSGTKRTAVTSSSALANQLYRSSSFHSSGRSSAGDGEEMYSDGSLEDEVIDLTQKVHHLQEKFSVLAENQTDVDDRYVRIKQENAELSTKLFIAEESLRDVEQRAEEKLKVEQRRFKDTVARVDREKQLQIENYDIRLRSCEKDLEHVRGEVIRYKQKLERERSEKIIQNDKLIETERELINVREDHRAVMESLRKERDAYLLESRTSHVALQELRKEFESLRKQKLTESSTLEFRRSHVVRFNSAEAESEASELKSRLIESEEENKRLKKNNLQLQETTEELSAQILNYGLEEGRILLDINKSVVDVGTSLAAEFEAMSQEQLKKALKEQTEVNDQLRTYIDGILLSIVENYPQLLEVKNKSVMRTAETPS